MSANLFIPLRNSKSLCPSGTLNTLITVPYRGERFQMPVNVKEARSEEKKEKPLLTFSEALASFVPDALNARAARGLS